MQFIINGPDVPEQLIQDHEDGKVIFFCGAGVSIPVGLPGSRKLLEGIYDELHISKEDIEKERFEYSLDNLEHTKVVNFRTVIPKLLAIKQDADLRTHIALIKLANQVADDSLRLVTTNYDHLFEKACQNLNIQHRYYSAPALPVPKKSKWNGIVYLHGFLPEEGNEKELSNLVITSGDFGLAYLTERWASHFVSELFRNFSVCFVGYSLDDPVMRYMTDAVSADRMLGEKLPNVWAFVSYGESVDREEERKKWENKGIRPILYSEKNNHQTLHDTLRVWSNIYSDGISGKEMLVAKYASCSPTQSTQEDNFVGRVLWALSDPSGKPAQRFATFEPNPCLDWLLGPFTQERVQQGEETGNTWLSKMKVEQTISPFVIPRTDSFTLPAPYNSIVSWSLRHLNDERLLLWMLEQGPQLRSFYKSLVLDKLEKLNNSKKAGIKEADVYPSEKMIALWKLFTVDALCLRDNLSYDFYSWREQFSQNGCNVSYDLRLQLRKLLSPKLIISRNIFQNGISIELGLAAEGIKDAIQGFDWAGSLHLFVSDFEQLLSDALSLAREVKQLTLLDLPSIEPDQQNQYAPNYAVLIELLRDSWHELFTSNPTEAKLIARRWLNSEEITFKRLGLFAASNDGAVSARDWIDFLAKNDCQNLWEIELRREVLRLFVKQGGKLRESLQTRLEKLILKGPSPSEYLPEQINQFRWLYLSKFQCSGVQLSYEGLSFLENIKKQYPSWVLATDQSDEFPIWCSGIEYINENDYVGNVPHDETQIKIWLKTEHLKEDLEGDFRNERVFLYTWRKICSMHLIKAARSAQAIITTLKTKRDRQIWSTLFDHASRPNRSKRSWSLFSKDVIGLNVEFYEELADKIAWWMYEASKHTDSQQECFFAISKKLMHQFVPKDENTELDPLTAAINNPLGHVVLSLQNLLYWQSPTDGKGLEGSFKQIFSELCNPTEIKYKPARILLSRNLVALFRIDREWTEQHLLPLFYWTKNKEASSMWRGFLQSPRLYFPLIVELKPNIIEARLHWMEHDFNLDKFSAFITYIALENADVIGSVELQKIYDALPLEALKRVAIVLRQVLESASDKKANFWNNRVKPFLHEFWPKDKDKTSSELSYFLAKLAIHSDESFSDVVSVISIYLRPLDRQFYLICKGLFETGHCEKYPQSSLILLSKLCPEKREYCFGNHFLSDCLKSIVQADNSLKLRNEYLELEKFIGS